MDNAPRIASDPSTGSVGTDRDATRNRFPWATLLLFYAIGLARCVDWFIIGALLTPIKNELRLPDQQLGQIGAIFFLASSFTSPIFGYLGDRFPRKPFILGALTVWNLAAICCGLTSSLTLLLVWRALVGLGQGCYETLLPGWIGDSFKPRWRSGVFGIINSTAPVGAAIGFLAGSYLATQLNWHYAFILTGAPGLVLAAAFVFAKEPMRGQSEEGKVILTTPTLRQTLQALSSPLFLVFLIGGMAFITGLGAISTWGPSFLHRAYGLTNEQASGFFATGWASAGCLGVLVGGWIGGIWRRNNPLAYSLIIIISSTVTAPALFIAFLGQSALLSQSFILVEIFFTSLCFGPINALLLETVPVNQRSAASALFVICAYGLSNVISADLIGAISDQSTLRLGMLVAPTAFVLSGLLLLVYVLLQFRSRSRQDPAR
ncbi:MAG: MFS transporter [Verrucomicrobia bacterium]|nr:MFS transporter [Verrucomicrobiota bacterium]